jgi:tetratricopeptide (TPR) repeat protein
MNRSIQVLIFVLYLCVFQASFSLAVEDKKSESFQKGLSSFEAGQYQQAFDRFLEAFLAEPGDPDVDFYLGRAAFEIGDFEMALMAFERILITSPETDRVKLEMARCYFKLGLNENAKEIFEEVLSSNPPDAVKRNIEKYLSVIKETERRHYFDGYISIGSDWDDNARYSPASEVVQTVIGDVIIKETDRPQEDWISNWSGFLSHTYRVSDNRVSWQTQVMGYQAFYEDETDLNTLYIGGETGPVFQFDRFALNMNGFFNYVSIDSEEYFQSVGIEPRFTLRMGKRARMNIFLRGESKEYADTPERDADNIYFALSPVFSIWKSRMSARLFYEIEDAQSDVYSYTRYGAKLTCEKEMNTWLSLFVSYEYQYKEYDGIEPLFDERRKDHLHYPTAGVNMTLRRDKERRPMLSLNTTYRYTGSDSNIELYDYSKNVASVSLVYLF